MTSPKRLLVRWRALPELKSHVDLIGWVAERMLAEVLILSNREIPWVENNSLLHVVRIKESFKLHPSTIRLKGWKEAALLLIPTWCSHWMKPTVGRPINWYVGPPTEDPLHLSLLPKHRPTPSASV